MSNETGYEELSLLSRPNFRTPTQPMVANGFRLTFRRYAENNAEIFWLPSHIHRNSQTGGWQIVFKHKTGRYRGWVGDNHRPKSVSLEEAWSHLLEALSNHRPAIKDRASKGGRPLLFDTGMSGVLIERKRGKGSLSHGVLVRVAQRIIDREKGPRTAYINTFNVREPRYREAPEFFQAEFRRGLCQAIALRRLYDVTNAVAPLSNPLSLSDLSDESIPAYPLVELDLGDVFASF